MSGNILKRYVAGIAIFVAVLSMAVTSIFNAQFAPAYAAGEVTLTVTVSDVIAGQANPEFTVMFGIEGNSGTIGGAEIVITPLDDNVSIGTAANNYVAGDTWSAANAGARIAGTNNIHVLGTDDAGITKSSFRHGGYKFTYNGTPSGGISFNVALVTICDDLGSPMPVRYNGATLAPSKDYTQANLTVTPRAVETANTLSALTLAVGSENIISGVGDDQTASKTIAYADRGNVKISATRAGARSKIKVVDSVGNKTLVSERTTDLSGSPLGTLEAGEHTLTVTVTSESGAVKTYTIKFTVDEPPAVPLAKPTISGSTAGGYSGSPLDFTPSGMAALVTAEQVRLYSVSPAGAETEVGIDAFKPTNVGDYKIIARPNDGYCWQGSDAADAEYTFAVNKAVLKATAGADGALPAFSSESYKGALDGIINFKYYSDSACTQEVAASELADGTEYYVKAVMTDTAGANFEFDTDAVTSSYTTAGVAYTKPVTPGTDPGKDPGVKDESVPFWVWIIVASAGAVIVMLLIVLLLSRGRRSADSRALEAESIREDRRRRADAEDRRRREEMRDEREERRREEDREERRRREEAEERRYERESRMTQQQMIPQMQQPMQPVMQQPIAASGSVDGALIAELKAEIEKLRAEQQAAKEVAATKTDASQQAIALQLAAMEKYVAEAKAEAVERTKFEYAQQLTAAKMEAEFAKMRAETKIMLSENSGKNLTVDTLGDMLADAIRKAAGTRIVSVQDEPKQALPESNIVHKMTDTMPHDGNTASAPEAEGLFNRRGKDKSYDPNNFYNFFDEQDKKD